jgi:hypothetical protein
MLNVLIALKSAELSKLAGRLQQPKARVRKLAVAQPGLWAEHLAQLTALCDYADSLPAQFASLVDQSAITSRSVRR